MTPHREDDDSAEWRVRMPGDGRVAIFGARRFYGGETYPDRPFVMRVVLHDIADTVIGAINALPGHCVAVTVASDLCIPRVGPRIERAARRRGMRVLWDDRHRRRAAVAMGRLEFEDGREPPKP